MPRTLFFNFDFTGKLLSPVVVQLSEQYPHVTTYKVDIDKVSHTILNHRFVEILDGVIS